MKSIFIAVALLFAAVAAHPIIQSEDVGEEFVPKEEDWQLVPDSEGYMHLVDINSFDMDAEPLFNAATDTLARLWTRQNTNAGQIVTINNNPQLDASNFVASRRTRFHVHGWNNGGPTTGELIRSSYLQHFDCNVFVVDWGAGAQTPNYLAARNRVNAVGAFLANYITWINSRGVPFSNIGIVGHSLGAHIAGAAGKRTPQRVQFISGLDPAGPLFSLDDPINRLHATDAVYTECIVTDAGRLGIDFLACIGNFFPNWGTSQPGCGIDLSGNCAHGRANDLKAASISPGITFFSTRCSGLDAIRNRSCPSAGATGQMGGDPPNNSGPAGTTFWLQTTGTHPFALGH